MKLGSPDLATLGHRIRHYRGERGYTLDQLGERSFVVIADAQHEPDVRIA